MKTVIALVIGATLTAVTATAQPRPYEGVAEPLCYLNPYALVSNCLDGQHPLLTTANHRIVIPEVNVGETGHEVSYLIIVNPERTPQDLLVEVLRPALDGTVTLPDGSTRRITHVKRLHVEGASSVTWDLQDDPLFYNPTPSSPKKTLTRFIVYLPVTGTAHVASWPRDAVGERGSVTVNGQVVPR